MSLAGLVGEFLSWVGGGSSPSWPLSLPTPCIVICLCPRAFPKDLLGTFGMAEGGHTLMALETHSHPGRPPTPPPAWLTGLLLGVPCFTRSPT